MKEGKTKGNEKRGTTTTTSLSGLNKGMGRMSRSGSREGVLARSQSLRWHHFAVTQRRCQKALPTYNATSS